jgi:hypothetical protein
MKSGTIEEKYTVLIMREVLIALSFLHRQGIIHRDVKGESQSPYEASSAGTLLIYNLYSCQHLANSGGQDLTVRLWSGRSSTDQQQTVNVYRHALVDGTRSDHRRKDVRHES